MNHVSEEGSRLTRSHGRSQRASDGNLDELDTARHAMSFFVTSRKFGLFSSSEACFQHCKCILVYRRGLGSMQVNQYIHYQRLVQARMAVLPWTQTKRHAPLTRIPRPSRPLSRKRWCHACAAQREGIEWTQPCRQPPREPQDLALEGRK